MSEVGDTSLLSVTGSVGYSVSDYYKNYFSGILADHPSANYVIFSTRENSGYSSFARYYLVLGDSLTFADGRFSGDNVTMYECYSSDSQYIQNVTTDDFSMSAGSYQYYSNLGNYSDIRGGGNYVHWLALLVLIASLFLYNVLSDILRNVVFRRTGRRRAGKLPLSR